MTMREGVPPPTTTTTTSITTTTTTTLLLFLLLLLLLLLLPSSSLGVGVGVGVGAYRVEAPQQYTALQGDLVVTVYLAPPPTTATPTTTTSTSTTTTTSTPTPSTSSVSRDFSEAALKVALYALGSGRALETFPVQEGARQDPQVFNFTCGIVVQGGVHYLRLERGTGQVLAESGQVSVRWPTLAVHTPLRLETYTTAAYIKLQFTRSICWQKSPVRFKTWVLLLYHGVPIGETPSPFHHHPYTPRPAPTTPTTSARDRPWTFLTKKPGGGIGWWKRRRRRRNKEVVSYRKMKRKTRRLIRRSKRRRRERFDAYDQYWKWKKIVTGRRRRRKREEGKEDTVEERVSQQAKVIPGARERSETGEGKLEVIPEQRNSLRERDEDREERAMTISRRENENIGLGEREKPVKNTKKGRREAQHNPGSKDPWRNTGRRRGGGGGQGQGHRSRSNTQPQPNFKVDLRPSVGDIVEATSQEPMFAWGGNATVQGVKLIERLYSNDSHTIVFPCDALGPAGYYSVRLVAPGLATASARLIVSSLWFKVEWSDEFTLQASTASIQPCYRYMGVRVTYPYCLSKKERDKVRVYARFRANVTSANPPVMESYVTEVPVREADKYVRFECKVFEREATEYCFVYVNTARTNVTSLVRRQCVPYYKPNALRKDGEWGAWSAWTPCTALCDGEVSSGGAAAGQRQRHRFCDSPPPRNGGRFCQGSALEEEACEAEGDGCARASQHQPSSVSSTPGGGGDMCSCGCTMALTSGSSTTIAASAADCYGTAVWLLQAPPGRHVVAEVEWAWLRPGGQWLKLRDGNSSAAPLLVLLPASPPRPTLARPAPRRIVQAPPRVSTGSVLLLEFHSDANTSIGSPNPATWGFLLTAALAESVPDGVGEATGVEEAPRDVGGRGLLEGMHVAAVVFVALLLVAVVVLAAIHWRHYRLYQRARLVPDSPYATPPGSPSNTTTTTTVASTLTLTEVISLKSLVLRPCLPVSLPLRRRGVSTSHFPPDKEPLCDTTRHSLPNSPFLTRRAATPSTLRRSSSQMSRLLRRGSGTFRRKRRRFASVDELESRCISPISEMQREDDGESGKETHGRRDDDEEVKYREHRKSLVGSEERRLTPKLAKERLNQERARRSILSRSTSAATVRPASSVSDVSSVNGTDTEMEYDYYDYDMDNASAVPGSLFGMDPLLLAWMPPFFTGSDGITPTRDAIPLEMLSLPEVLPSPAEASVEAPLRPTALPIPHLNIPNNTSPPRDPSMQTSLVSEEANDRVELQPDDEDPLSSPVAPFDEDSTPTANTCSKILNLDDIQFADDSDAADEL